MSEIIREAPWDELNPEQVSAQNEQLAKKNRVIDEKYRMVRQYRKGRTLYKKTFRTALVDRGKEIELKGRIDQDKIDAIIELAQAKGWASIAIEGSQKFKRRVYLAAARSGIAVRGYEPPFELKHVADAAQKTHEAAQKNKIPLGIESGQKSNSPAINPSISRTAEAWLREFGIQVPETSSGTNILSPSGELDKVYNINDLGLKYEKLKLLQKEVASLNSAIIQAAAEKSKIDPRISMTAEAWHKFGVNVPETSAGTNVLNPSGEPAKVYNITELGLSPENVKIIKKEVANRNRAIILAAAEKKQGPQLARGLGRAAESEMER